MKKIYIINANPVKNSFTYYCANRYEEEAKKAGAEVRRANIEEMDFDPVLHNGYDEIQELEPALLKFQDDTRWADHLVFFYPNWWSTMPAKMKGLFDRAFLPKFAFSFDNNKLVPLLTDKTARIVNIVGSADPMLLRIKMGSYTNELSKGILGECGVKVKYVCSYGPTRKKTQKQKDKFLCKVGEMAKSDSY